MCHVSCVILCQTCDIWSHVFTNHYIRVLCFMFSLISSDLCWSIDVPNALIHLKQNCEILISPFNFGMFEFLISHFPWFHLLWSARMTELLVQNQQRNHPHVIWVCKASTIFRELILPKWCPVNINNMLLPKWPLHFFGCKEISTWGRLNRWDRPRLFGNTLAPG